MALVAPSVGMNVVTRHVPPSCAVAAILGTLEETLYT